MTAASAERYTVQSVVRALAVLDVLAAPSPAGGHSVTEVAEATELSKSAAFAVLQTLLAAGYVADNGAGQHRRYRLGRALTRLGDRAREQSPLREVAHPTLQRLASELEMSVRIGVLQGPRVLIIDQEDVAGGLRIDLRMGDRERLHCTAVGKAILAWRSDSEVRQALGKERLVRQTAHTITDQRKLLAHLRSVRQRGYSVDDEEDFEGITCIGAPVRDHTGQVIAAISVTTVKARLTSRRVDEIGRELRAGADEISAAMGFVQDQG